MSIEIKEVENGFVVTNYNAVKSPGLGQPLDRVDHHIFVFSQWSKVVEYLGLLYL